MTCCRGGGSVWYSSCWCRPRRFHTKEAGAPYGGVAGHVPSSGRRRAHSCRPHAVSVYHLAFHVICTSFVKLSVPLCLVFPGFSLDTYIVIIHHANLVFSIRNITVSSINNKPSFIVSLAMLSLSCAHTSFSVIYYVGNLSSPIGRWKGLRYPCRSICTALSWQAIWKVLVEQFWIVALSYFRVRSAHSNSATVAAYTKYQISLDSSNKGDKPRLLAVVFGKIDGYNNANVSDSGTRSQTPVITHSPLLRVPAHAPEPRSHQAL